MPLGQLHRKPLQYRVTLQEDPEAAVPRQGGHLDSVGFQREEAGGAAEGARSSRLHDERDAGHVRRLPLRDILEEIYANQVGL